MKDFISLKRKIAAYSAIAGALMLIKDKKSDAQVIYHDIDPDITLDESSSNFQLDLNNDGVTDFGFSWSTALATFDLYGVGYPYPNASMLFKPAQWKGIYALNSCQLISNDSPVNKWEYQSGFIDNNGGNSLFWDVGGVDRYIGLRLHLVDGYHYGWIRMVADFGYDEYDGHMTFKDYAYNTSPDSSIETPCYQQTNNVAQYNLFNAFIEAHHLIINFSQPSLRYEIILFNEMGMKLYEQSNRRSQTVIDVRNLSPGIYFVEVNNSNKRELKRIVID